MNDFIADVSAKTAHQAEPVSLMNAQRGVRSLFNGRQITE
jgi:hypothetical protein